MNTGKLINAPIRRHFQRATRAPLESPDKSLGLALASNLERFKKQSRVRDLKHEAHDHKDKSSSCTLHNTDAFLTAIKNEAIFASQGSWRIVRFSPASAPLADEALAQLMFGADTVASNVDFIDCSL